MSAARIATAPHNALPQPPVDIATAPHKALPQPPVDIATAPHKALPQPPVECRHLTSIVIGCRRGKFS